MGAETFFAGMGQGLGALGAVSLWVAAISVVGTLVRLYRHPQQCGDRDGRSLSAIRIGGIVGGLSAFAGVAATRRFLDELNEQARAISSAMPEGMAEGAVQEAQYGLDGWFPLWAAPVILLALVVVGWAVARLKARRLGIRVPVQPWTREQAMAGALVAGVALAVSASFSAGVFTHQYRDWGQALERQTMDELIKDMHGQMALARFDAGCYPESLKAGDAYERAVTSVAALPTDFGITAMDEFFQTQEVRRKVRDNPCATEVMLWKGEPVTGGPSESGGDGAGQDE